MSGKINKEWHEKNKMPENPTFEQKVEMASRSSKKLFLQACSRKPLRRK